MVSGNADAVSGRSGHAPLETPRGEAAGGSVSSDTDFIWLAAILALAAVLRTVGLDSPLWFDEIATVDSHLRLPWHEMMTDYSMNHHYFFSLQAKLASAVFGPENWAYRLPAMIFGLGTVAAVWWLARDIAGARIAHVSALLVALSYHQVWFSQNARGYTELAFWSTLGLIFFLRGMARPKAATWIGFGLAAAAAVFTHLTGAFFFVALGLVWLVALATGFGRPPLTRAQVMMPLLGVLAGVAVVLALYLPVLPSVLETVGGVAETSAGDPMQEYQNPLWTVLEGLRTAFGRAGPLALFVGACGLAVTGLGAVGTHRKAPLFFWIVAAHVVVTVGVLLALNMRIWPRFFFVDIGLLLVLITVGCATGARIAARIVGRAALEPLLFGAATVAMLGLSLALVSRNYGAPKQDLAAAHALAEEVRTDATRVYAVGPSAALFRSHFEANWGEIHDPGAYDAALAEPGPVIFVVAFPDRMFRTIPALEADADGTLTLLRALPGTLGDGAVLVYRRD